MKNVLLVDPFSGASGDMFLAALVDVGVPFEALRDVLLGIRELSTVSAERQTVKRGIFQATRIKVNPPDEKVHRSLSDILAIIEAADLGGGVAAGAAKTFTLLAEAEAKVHGSAVEDVHFHEVGALDAIFDIVGAHVALDLLGNPLCLTRPVTLGSGTTTGAHGEIPVPAPATLELLAGHRVKFSEVAEELVTPTGAAIIASMFRPIDAGTIVVPDRIGYGAGGRDRKGLPNLLRAVAGSAVEEGPGDVCIVTSTIDDMNPEVYGYVMEKLFEEGALEVYYNPVMMKKNRPGIEVTLITEEEDVYRVADCLMSHTTTLGVRIHREERIELPRRRDTVETPYGTVEVKVADRPGGGETVGPEYESCKAAAEKAGVNLVDVYEAVRRAWHRKRQE